MSPADRSDLKALVVIVLLVAAVIFGVTWAATAISNSYVWTCDTTRIGDGWRTSCGRQ